MTKLNIRYDDMLNRYYVRCGFNDTWFIYEQRGARQHWRVDQSGKVAVETVESASVRPILDRLDLPVTLARSLVTRFNKYVLACEVCGGVSGYGDNATRVTCDQRKHEYVADCVRSMQADLDAESKPTGFGAMTVNEVSTGVSLDGSPLGLMLDEMSKNLVRTSLSSVVVRLMRDAFEVGRGIGSAQVSDAPASEMFGAWLARRLAPSPRMTVAEAIEQQVPVAVVMPFDSAHDLVAFGECSCDMSGDPCCVCATRKALFELTGNATMYGDDTTRETPTEPLIEFIDSRATNANAVLYRFKSRARNAEFSLILNRTYNVVTMSGDVASPDELIEALKRVKKEVSR